MDSTAAETDLSSNFAMKQADDPMRFYSSSALSRGGTMVAMKRERHAFGIDQLLASKE